MPRVSVVLNAVTDGRRSTYLFDTTTAAEAVGCVPNKFGDWWRRNEGKLIELAKVAPAEVGAHFAMILARAAEENRSEAQCPTK